MMLKEKRVVAAAECRFGPAPTGRRKVALGCARVDRYDSPFAHPEVRAAVRLVREYAEGKRTAADLAAGARRLDAVAAAARSGSAVTIFEARRAAAAAEDGRTARAVAEVLRWLIGEGPAGELPVKRDPAWLTADVLALVAVIDHDRAFELMPVLADALEDAGCADARVLDHCRCCGPHAPGCWVVDLLMGRE